MCIFLVPKPHVNAMKPEFSQREWHLPYKLTTYVNDTNYSHKPREEEHFKLSGGRGSKALAAMAFL